MEITNTSTEEFGIEVTATAAGKEETFYVQLTDNKYRNDLGCWVTTDTSDGDIDQDDYQDFDVSQIIEAAEKHASEEFINNYDEEEIEFNCSINSCSVYMRIEKNTDEVELVIKDTGYVGDYQRRYKETGVKFENRSEAEEYANKFRTDDYQDCSGLYQFMQDIEQEG